MKNRIIKIGSFGAIIISLLMISRSTAINVSQSDTATSMKKNVYIDPTICLTKGQVSKLQQAVQFIDDSKDKAIVQQIIQTLKVKGKVDGNEIKDIVCKLNIYDRSFYTGFLNVYGSGCRYLCFPIFPLRWIFGGGFIYFGTMIIASWETSQFQHYQLPGCNINGRPIFTNQANKGIVLFGYGGGGNLIGNNNPGYFGGLFALIIVSSV
jgi:hypothetical protein